MDIDLFSKMIKELILDNDRVVLPGLGCFVAEMVPATFSDKGYTINPPYRRLYFRSKPDTDDVLMNFYAESNGLDRAVACRVLGDFIAELRTIIFTKKLVVLPGLGRLRATKENNIFFIADEDLDIYPAGFGLEPISLKTHQETQQEVSAAVVGLRSLLDQTTPSDPEPMAVRESEHVTAPVLPESESVISPVVSESDPVTAPVVPETEPVEVEVPVEMPPVGEPESTEPVEEIRLENIVEAPVQEMQNAQMLELAAETESSKKPSYWKKALATVGILAAIAVLLLIAYVVVAHVAPEWLDSILYTPEELEIINRAL